MPRKKNKPRAVAIPLTDRITLLRGRFTLDELGARYGVSRSTIRRWQTGDSVSKPELLKKIDKRMLKSALSAEKFLKKKYKSDARKEGYRYRDVKPQEAKFRGKKFTAVRMVYRGTKRKLKERDKFYRETGREYVSDWTNYDVRVQTFAQVAALIQVLIAEEAYAVQYIYQGSSKNPAYPRVRGATQPMLAAHEGISGLLEELELYLTLDSTAGSAGKLLYVGVIYDSPSKLQKKRLAMGQKFVNNKTRKRIKK